MEIVDRLKGLQFQVSRALLFAWIKPTVLGDSQLELTDEDSVCYVLPFRSTADLLVTDKCCENAGLPLPTHAINQLDEKRAVFFVGHPEGRLGRRTQRHQSERLTRLFDHQEKTDREIKIVPVSVFWGHQPDREKSFFKLILSENWTVTNSFKKLLAIIFHPRHIVVQYSTPLNLKQLIAGEPLREKQIRKLLRVLRVHFNHQRQAIIGPDLSHRRTLINTMLAGKTIKDAIEKESKRTRTTIQTVEKRAQAYAREIASHQSYRVIRFFHLVLTWLWHKLYDGIDVNNISEVKVFAQSHEIIYVPSHRSHMDYLLLSYVLYHNGLTPPHIAAGENLNLPIVGSLLRRAGAFFMRRSFHGDLLYKTVFDEYLHQMFIKGYSVEYFIEGSRSRTGRTLVPKTGMLSMTINSFQRDSHRPICLMPVYFGYERVLEVGTYMGELMGKSKKSESLIDIVRILRSLKYEFGKVTVNFGQPLLLREFLDEYLPPWQTPEVIETSDFSAVCAQLANTLVTRINCAVAVNPVTLVATALLATPRQTMEEQQLLRQIELLRALANKSRYSDKVTITDLPAPDIVRAAINIAGVAREEHTFGTTISADPKLAAMLAYYRNNVANVFVIPSLIARYVLSHETTSLRDITSFVTDLYPYLRSEYLLPWRVNEIESLSSDTVNTLVDLGLLVTTEATITATKPTSANYASLTYLGQIIEPSLERFHIVIMLLEAKREGTLRRLESDASAIAQKLSTLHGINSPTFFDRSLFANFINTLKSRDMIALGEDGITITDDFSTLSASTANTLDAGIRYHVLQAINP